MNNFNVSNWFEQRAKLDIQAFTVEGIDFELMALTDDLKENVELCETYKGMISLAANEGISYNRKRVADDKDLSKDLDLLWGLESLDIDSDPCIKYRVGEKVCEISGLSDALAKMLASEQPQEVIVDGDNLDAEEVQAAMDNSHADALEYQLNQNLA
jgi:hypothetical protein